MICGYMWLSFVKDFCVCYVCVFMSLDLYVCEIIPPCLPSPYTKHLPFIPSIILPLPLFKRCSECLLFCLRDTFSHFYFLVVDRLLYLFFCSIHCLSFLRELYIYCFQKWLYGAATHHVRPIFESYTNTKLYLFSPVKPQNFSFLTLK